MTLTCGWIERSRPYRGVEGSHSHCWERGNRNDIRVCILTQADLHRAEG